MKNLDDHVCQKWDIIELQNVTMGRIGAPCEFIHPLVMGDVMCNKKQSRMGGMDAPLNMYGMVSAPH